MEHVINNITDELQSQEETNRNTTALDAANGHQLKEALAYVDSPQKTNGHTMNEFPLQQIVNNYTEPLRQAIGKLQRKLLEPTQKKFYMHRRVAHLLPLTNVCFDRSGTRCLTGSYDRICRIINTQDVGEAQLLKGHDNVVFSVAFNQPKWYFPWSLYEFLHFHNYTQLIFAFNSDKVVTGSFDGTARVWQASNGQSLCTLYGHTAELVMAEFDPIQSTKVATASMDSTVRLYDTETALELQLLRHHGAEVIACRFRRCGNMLLSASFDSTAAIWDIRSGWY